MKLNLCKNCFVSDCTHDIDEESYLPSDVVDMVTCEMPVGCGGLDCCLDLSFTVPLGVDTVTYENITFWYRFDACDYKIEFGFGTWNNTIGLLDYDFGKYLHSVKIPCFFKVDI